MQSNFLKAGLLALGIVVTFFLSWELYLRSKGHNISYDDGEPLWSRQREKVYSPSDRATVFIGSSRIKFDLDIPTWETLTGDDALQLAFEGSSPLPVLYDLAEDPNFKGKMVIDVTEGLFITSAPPSLRQPVKSVAYFKKETPTQRASFAINKVLESQFVFLDNEAFTINRYLDALRIKDRPGVFGGPFFPIEFGKVSYERQTSMMDVFVKDTVLQNKVKGVWAGLSRMSMGPPASGAKLDSIFYKVTAAVNKIKSRGGQVIFVRTPSSGPFWMGEQKVFPREKYWDRLLEVSKSEGIHFTDYPSMANFICPEDSHLSPADAVVFTKALITALEQKGWKFPHKPAVQKQLAAK